MESDEFEGLHAELESLFMGGGMDYNGLVHFTPSQSQIIILIINHNMFMHRLPFKVSVMDPVSGWEMLHRVDTTYGSAFTDRIFFK